MTGVNFRRIVVFSAILLFSAGLGACKTVSDTFGGSDFWTQTGSNDDLVVLSVGIRYQGRPGRIASLTNPGRDSQLIGQAFGKISGADVKVVAETNGAPDFKVSYGVWKAAIDDFMAAAEGKTAVLYYAGHGVQHAGENYLLLGDGITLIPVLAFLDELKKRADTVIVFFDACRNNPFSHAHNSDDFLEVRSFDADGSDTPNRILVKEFAASGNGLARLSRGLGQGTKVIFATEAGRVALDAAVDNKQNSPFALAVADQIGERRSLTGVVAEIQREVLQLTKGRQNPVSENALGGREVFLAGRPITPI